MPTLLDPTAIQRFRFTARSVTPDGQVRLHYALDDDLHFVETFDIPLEPGVVADEAALGPLLDLLHWVAGVSYFKMAAPPEVVCEGATPTPAVADYLEALYSEGLGEFAYTNRERLPGLPRPRFPRADRQLTAVDRSSPSRVLVPVGGGKDSIVALEIVKRAGLDLSLFVVKPLDPMRRTAAVSGVPMIEVVRHLDGQVGALNADGALNGHIPITAIICCVALIAAKLNGYDAVALANERSASSGNLVHDGIEVNHQFSKSFRAEQLLRAAAAEVVPDVDIFSLLRPASELSIARAFAQRLPEYHHAFTSCNRNFHIDPAKRGGQAWCRDCPKCRFVFLMLAPFLPPGEMVDIFGGAMLDDGAQFEGFLDLVATYADEDDADTGTRHKPFECVGEEAESLAAIGLLAERPDWAGQQVLQRLIREVLETRPPSAVRIDDFLALDDREHAVPSALIEQVRAFL